MAKNLLGKKCPAFKAEATNNQTLSNASFEGKNLVIYFYPKDSTPGCTTEGQEFRDSYKIFKKMNTEIGFIIYYMYFYINFIILLEFGMIYSPIVINFQ